MSRITRLRRWCMLDDGSGLAPKPPPSSSRSGFRKLRRVISQPFIMQLRGSIASIWGRQIVGPIDNNAVFTGRIINRRSFYCLASEDQASRNYSPPRCKRILRSGSVIFSRVPFLSADDSTTSISVVVFVSQVSLIQSKANSLKYAWSKICSNLFFCSLIVHDKIESF